MITVGFGHTRLSGRMTREDVIAMFTDALDDAISGLGEATPEFETLEVETYVESIDGGSYSEPYLLYNDKRMNVSLMGHRP